MRDPAGKIHGSFPQASIPLGAGGFVGNMDISADGQRLVIGTDVMNGYVRDVGEPRWRELFSPTTVGGADALDAIFASAGGITACSQGVGAVRIAPSNKDIIYAAFYNRLFRSNDGGRTIAPTSSRPIRVESNAGAGRASQRALDVHPTNPDIVMVGTHGDGAWYSTNGGATLKQIAGLPAARTLARYVDGSNPMLTRILVCIDPTNPARCYVHVWGHGLFGSASGVAGPYVAIAGGPPNSAALQVDTAGNVWVTRGWESHDYDNNDPNHPKAQTPRQVSKYTPGKGWSHSTPLIFPIIIALDPSNADHALISENAGHLNETFDGGQSWHDVTFPDTPAGRLPGEVPWIAKTPSIFPGSLVFDTATPGKLWMSEGIGVCHATLAKGHTDGWVDHSAGIEELIGMFGVSIPGVAEPILSCQDKPFWRITSYTDYTNSFGYPVPPGRQFDPVVLAFGGQVDHAIDDPSYLVGLCGLGFQNGYSTDAGRSWTQWAKPDLPGHDMGPLGSIAVSTRNNTIILTSGNEGIAIYTKDGGKSWKPLSIGGIVMKRWSNAFFTPKRNVAADKGRPGHFALVTTTNTFLAPDSPQRNSAGLWTTADGGDTWTRRFSGVINDEGGRDKPGHDVRQFWMNQLGYVYGKPGELLYTSYSDQLCDFYHSADDGATWRALGHADARKGAYNVASFDTGKPLAGQSYPSVWFTGTVSGVVGTFVTFDFFATPPVLISRYPGGSIAPGSGIVADKNIFGRAYVSAGGWGWVAIRYSDKARAA
jgi:photosystem II stability/assembly factor-like uncharacterized protein